MARHSRDCGRAGVLVRLLDRQGVAQMTVKGGFWQFSHMGFSPRVRAVSKHWCEFFKEWRILCRVTGRDAAHKYHGYTVGRELYARPSALFRKRRVLRNTFGRMEYRDRITAAEIDALPRGANLN